MAQRFGFSAARSIHSYIRDNCDRLFICTTAPSSYSAASSQPQMIVSAAVTGDEWTITSGAQGPALTFNSRTLTIEGSASASHLVFANASGSRILAVTNVSSGTIFSSGNTVTVPVWRAEIAAGDIFYTVPATQGETVAAPTVFSPNNIADIQLWFAPESAVTVTAGRVTQWNDKSGFGRHATNAVSASMPVHASASLNGYNTLAFSSTAPGRKLFINSTVAACAVASSALSSFSGAIVLNTSSESTTQRPFQVGVVSAVSDNIRHLRVIAGRWGWVEVITATTTVVNASTSIVANTSHVLRWIWTSGRASLWEDGVQIITSARVSAGDGLAIGSTPQFIIGAAGNDGAPFIGTIAELIITSTAMTSGQGRELDKLLGAKYGIAIT